MSELSELQIGLAEPGDADDRQPPAPQYRY
jgi:hypothetical protein